MKFRYRTRLIVGSILFGVLVFGTEIIKDGQWNWKGLLWVVYGMVGFGILFNICFKLIIKEYGKEDQKDDTEKKDNNLG